jgi:hypothetical protein
MCCNKAYITLSYIRIRQVTLLVLEIKVNLKRERDVFYISIPSFKKIFPLIQDLLKKKKTTRAEYPSQKKKVVETLYCL